MFLLFRVHKQVTTSISFNGDGAYCLHILWGNSAGVKRSCVLIKLIRFNYYWLTYRYGQIRFFNIYEGLAALFFHTVHHAMKLSLGPIPNYSQSWVLFCLNISHFQPYNCVQMLNGLFHICICDINALLSPRALRCLVLVSFSLVSLL